MAPHHTNDGRLPFSYKLVIVSSAATLFVLGVVYFTQLRPAVETSFQLYGAPKIVANGPAAFRVIQYDNRNKTNLPARIVQAGLSQSGKQELTSNPVATSTLPADIELTPTSLAPGRATLALQVAGFNGEDRSFEIPVDIVPMADASLEAFRLVGDVSASISDGPWRVGLLPGFGGLVDSVLNPIWIRIEDKDGNPLSLTVEYRFATDAPKQPPRKVVTSQDGLAKIDCPLDGLSQVVTFSIQNADETLLWEERLPADSFVGLSQLPSAESSDKIAVEVHSSSPEQTLFCAFWAGSSPLSFATVETRDHVGTVRWTPPGEGLYWFTCNDHYLTGEGFLATLALPWFKDPEEFIQSVTSSDDPVAATLAATTDNPRLVAQYIQDHLRPGHNGFVQLLNSYYHDLEGVQEKTAKLRALLLILIAVVGFGLLLWAFAVAAVQHRTLRRNFREFQQQEDVGDELAVEGIARKRPFLPAILVLLAGVANLVALIWLLMLIFLD